MKAILGLFGVRCSGGKVAARYLICHAALLTLDPKQLSLFTFLRQ
jgi:hypothetical protein